MSIVAHRPAAALPPLAQPPQQHARATLARARPLRLAAPDAKVSALAPFQFLCWTGTFVQRESGAAAECGRINSADAASQRTRAAQHSVSVCTSCCADEQQPMCGSCRLLLCRSTRVAAYAHNATSCSIALIAAGLRLVHSCIDLSHHTFRIPSHTQTTRRAGRYEPDASILKHVRQPHMHNRMRVCDSIPHTLCMLPFQTRTGTTLYRAWRPARRCKGRSEGSCRV